ncbi:MAG: helix-turn-helix domain-containing protein [Candidatus Sericytochromatia bacterium]|nr:helix-turn-helix domain-containing protein [Candidatus Sericytochromatia bacterium]
MKVSINPIKNEHDYENALKRIDELWGSEINTHKGDELDILITLTEKYEDDNFPILPPDPIEAIKFRLEQMGLSQKDLAKLIGSNRASEIMNKKRRLTIDMIKKLHNELKIPAEALLV